MTINGFDHYARQEAEDARRRAALIIYVFGGIVLAGAGGILAWFYWS